MLFFFFLACGLAFFLVVCVVRDVACSYIFRGGAVRFFFTWLWLRSSISCFLWLGVALLVINS